VVGKIHFEEIDAIQYASWGFDYLKYDWIPNDVPSSERKALALKAQKGINFNRKMN